MGKRFEVYILENANLVTALDNQTKKAKTKHFESKDNLSFLEALRDAVQELLDVLKADKNNDTDSARTRREKQSVLTMVQSKL